MWPVLHFCLLLFNLPVFSWISSSWIALKLWMWAIQSHLFRCSLLLWHSPWILLIHLKVTLAQSMIQFILSPTSDGFFYATFRPIVTVSAFVATSAWCIFRVDHLNSRKCSCHPFLCSVLITSHGHAYQKPHTQYFQPPFSQASHN